MKQKKKNIPFRINENGHSYILESIYDAVRKKYCGVLEELANERIVLNPDLSQVQKDRLELKNYLRKRHGFVKRPLYTLSPKIKQELRDLFYATHSANPKAKQRFDDAIAKPKPSRRWRGHTYSGDM